MKKAIELKFKLLKDNEIVGYETHKTSSHYNKPQIRIFHSKKDGIEWDIKEWPERYIEHEAKRCVHENTFSVAGLAQCLDCGFEIF